MTEVNNNNNNNNNPIKLIDLKPKEVLNRYKTGELNKEAVDIYRARKDLAENGLMNMEPSNVKAGYTTGILNENEVDAYIDQHNNKVWYALGETIKTPITAIAKGSEELLQTAMEMAQYVPGNAGLLANEAIMGKDDELGTPEEQINTA